MASKIFRPRRGTASANASIVLESGELFFEYPSGGVGTGKVKVKMGDGSTAYSSLPYAIDTDSVSDVTVTFSNASSSSSYSTLYGNLTSGATLSTLMTNIKGLFYYFNNTLDSSITEVNDDIDTINENLEAMAWGTF